MKRLVSILSLTLAVGMLLLTALSLRAAPDGTTYYVAPNGSDSNSGTSPGQPWATFNRAWQSLYPGDTLILKDGIYYQQLQPNQRNGQPGNPITIKAQNDGQAIIDGQGLFIPVRLGEAWPGPIGQYFVIEGIVARNSSDSVYEIVDDNNVLRRVSGYNANTNLNAHVFDIFANNTLIEDCIAAGSGRKMILIYNSQNNVVRRCFTYWTEWDGRDWCDPWPWGENINIYNASYNIVENSIGYGYVPYRSVSIIANAAHVSAVGNQVLGSIGVWAGMNDDGTPHQWGTQRPQPTTCTQIRDFGWEGQRAGFQLFGSGAVHDNVIRDLYIYGSAGLGFNDMTSNGLNNVLDHATIVNNGLDNISGGSGQYGGVHTDARQVELNKLTVTNSYIENIFVDWPNYPTGPRVMTSMNGAGARINNRYVDGVLTSQPLWPWPMEGRIQAELGFSLTDRMMTLLSLNGYLMSTNTAGRIVDPGGVTTFRVDIEASGTFSQPVTVTLTPSSPDLRVEPATRVVTPPGSFRVTVTDLGPAPSSPARSYTVQIAADGGGMAKGTSVAVNVRARYLLFMPLVILAR